MIKRFLVLSAAALMIAAPSANAQRSSQRGSTPIELGIDGAIVFELDAPHGTALVLPLQDFRIGFLVSDKFELEPRFNLTSVHSGGVSATDYTFELGTLYQPAGDRVGKGLYGRPFFGVTGSRATGFASSSSGYLGLGVGLKIPFSDRRLASRLEANYAHGFSNGGSNAIAVLFGLSFFTR
ncbi:MAG TPA: hypothetical protein VGO33_11275 [Gemmatimonadaceae bacterium]|nr:hypothetical protein [Gemmatimonadaceae bacterium]